MSLFSGTALGYYVYVEASQGSSWDLATFESTWLKQSSSTCVVSFWYHMYGTGIGTLYGYIKVGQTYSRLFEEYGNKGKANETVFLFCLLFKFRQNVLRAMSEIRRNSFTFLFHSTVHVHCYAPYAFRNLP